MEEPEPIQIPSAGLAPETLRHLIEDVVTRDGTEHTDAEVKIQQVLRALERGEVEIWFNPVDKTCSLNRVL